MMVKRSEVTFDSTHYGIGVSKTTEHVFNIVPDPIRVLPYVGD